jgi:hypothetical protein
MTLIAKLPARNKYKCDCCGALGFMEDPDWRRYSSIAHDETCPDEMPTACIVALSLGLPKQCSLSGPALHKPRQHPATASHPLA